MLIVLGSVLGLDYSGVVIVLDYLGITLLAALPFLFLSTRELFILAAAMTAAGPIVVGTIRALASSNPAGMQAPGMLTVSDLSSKRVRRVARRLLTPITVLGAMALSVYVLHVLLLMGVRGGFLIPAAITGEALSGNPVGWL